MKKNYLKKNPFIDIIMPNFNKGKYLNKAINSVLNQSYKNWKLYIIDDFSNDNSSDILKKIKKMKKINIFQLKKNKGPSYCRNLGIKFSKSKYIAFLDSDDIWFKDKLKLQLSYMIKNDYKFTFSDYTPILYKGNVKKRLKETKIENFFNYDKFLRNSSINTSTIILERKYLKKIKFKRKKLMEDYVFKCDLMRKTKIPFIKFSKSLAIYRIIKDSRSSNKISNLFNLWLINKKYNKLSFFSNLQSIFFISINSLKKYGFK